MLQISFFLLNAETSAFSFKKFKQKQKQMDKMKFSLL